MSEWCIVAIPEEGSLVWKLSSEKVPHLTLLYLGEQDDPMLAGEIASYLQHAVSTSLNKFDLGVKGRGVLGENKADVLFFDPKSCSMQLKTFRSHLLKNDLIRGCYDSAPQYPSWTPHLTLGYPKTPAKKIPGMMSNPIHSVLFDRIALWNMDYDGPTFPLEWGELSYGEMAMSENSGGELLQSKDPAPSNLRHHGFGTKQRPHLKTFEQSLASALRLAARSSVDISNESRYILHMASGRTLDDLDSPTAQQYIRENQIAFLTHLDKVVGGRPSERVNRKYDAFTRSNGDWVVSSIDMLTHSGIAETRVRPITDELGRIVDYDILHDSLDAEDARNALMHYGVKGMKWGVRRKSVDGSDGGTPSARQIKRQEKKDAKAEAKQKKVQAKIDAKDRQKQWRKEDREAILKRPVTVDAAVAQRGRNVVGKHGTDALSNKDLQALVQRMNLEQQYANLKDNEKAAKGRNAGRDYVTDILKDVGREMASEAVKYAATEAFKYAFTQGKGAAQNSRDRRRANSQRVSPMPLPSPMLAIEAPRRAIGR